MIQVASLAVIMWFRGILKRLQSKQRLSTSHHGSQMEKPVTNDPRAWSRIKKLRVLSIICLYTFVVYLGSTLSLGMYPTFMIKYQLSLLTASLTMALYVAGYGIGAMLFSPLSEVESIGRNPPYLCSFTIFTAISLGICYVDSFSGLLALRFFQGFFGSPALATGGATLHDMYDMPNIPFAFVAWVAAATCGPAFGPAISVYGVTAYGFRWPMWLLFWLSLGCLVIMLIALPETLRATLERRANGTHSSDTPPSGLRLGPSELASKASAIVWKPLSILLTNPAIFFANFYTCLVYAIYYSFFESFPRVYLEVYRFSFRDFSLTFLSITVGTVVGVAVYIPWALWWRNVSRSPDRAKRRPEACLVPAIFGSSLVPAGLFLFAFTTPDASWHWSIGLVGVAVQTIGVFIVLQCLANYLLLAYPRDAASLLAGNDFMRASLAAAAVVFSQPLYDHLGVRHGVLALAAVTVLCVLGMVLLYAFGHVARRDDGVALLDGEGRGSRVHLCSHAG